MTGLSNQKVTLGQGDGSEVELIVTGTELYATYETLDGYPAVYDDDLELFCYARLVDGRFESTGGAGRISAAARCRAPCQGVRRRARRADRRAAVTHGAVQPEHRGRTGTVDERDLR